MRAPRAAGGERLRKATDWVGIDSYPGTFVPSAFADPADALLEPSHGPGQVEVDHEQARRLWDDLKEQQADSKQLQRDVDQLLVQRPAVLEALVLAERLAVIRDDRAEAFVALSLDDFLELVAEWWVGRNR